MNVKVVHYEREHAKDLLLREVAARTHILASAKGHPRAPETFSEEMGRDF